MKQVTHTRLALCAGLLSFSFSPTAADEAHMSIAAPEGHAPIIVMGDHMHAAGEYMLSVRQMTMSMRGNIRGRKNIADTAILDLANQHGSPPQLRVVPQHMDMKMTMLGAMYARSDTVTLVLMAMQMENEMRLQAYNNMTLQPCAPFVSKSEGTGDTMLGALMRGGKTATGAWHYGLGLSVPTGSVRQTGRPAATPMGCNLAAMDERLPYPMQLGSGSYDLKPAITYNGDWGGWRVGAQAGGVLRLEDNDTGYRLGDRFELQGWAAKRLTAWASASARVDISHQGKINGKDKAITLPVSTAQPNFSGGTYANLSLGVNLIGQSGTLANHRLAVEWVTPIHQDANGVQMKRNETLMIGWQKAF